MTKKTKLCGNNAVKMIWFRFIYVLQSSWIVDIGINLYRQQYQAKGLLTDSSITENETSPKHLSKICYLQKCEFLNFVLMLSTWLSHWLVMRWTKYHRFCRFCLFLMFFGLTPRHVKTSDKTIHQGYSQQRKMSCNKFRQENIENYFKITLQQRSHKPYTLCRQPYCSVEGRISRSTATLRSTGSVDSIGREIGITPVFKLSMQRPDIWMTC